ncbi:collagen alpha-1(I) chain-like [Physeter macrocephalus]|uniref:Collagen alpha-1(I) chain-like n=1 Tax=Physeter macrocephalus TaxID=9755 RepID=A0A9W2X2U8_PHYMC|nr:collagen alpha-1(I) chain-like [Physeter catodon]
MPSIYSEWGGGRGWPGPLWRHVGSVKESGPLPRTSTAGVGWASSAGKGATGPGNGRGEPNEGLKGAPLGRSARRTRERRGSASSRCPEGTRAPTSGQGLGREESRGVWGPPQPPPTTSSPEGAPPAITRPGGAWDAAAGGSLAPPGTGTGRRELGFRPRRAESWGDPALTPGPETFRSRRQSVSCELWCGGPTGFAFRCLNCPSGRRELGRQGDSESGDQGRAAPLGEPHSSASMGGTFTFDY